MWCWRIGCVKWRIPAATRAEAEDILLRCLGLAALPPEARFVGREGVLPPSPH